MPRAALRLLYALLLLGHAMIWKRDAKVAWRTMLDITAAALDPAAAR